MRFRTQEDAIPMKYEYNILPIVNRDEDDDAEYNEEEPLAEDDLGDEGADVNETSDDEEDA